MESIQSDDKFAGTRTFALNLQLNLTQVNVENPRMFQIRPIWLSPYKARRLCTWVAAYTSPSKVHAGSISNSPPCADRNKQGLFVRRQPGPSLEEMETQAS